MRSSIGKITAAILAKVARITIALSLFNSVEKTAMRTPDFAPFCHKK